MENAATLSSQQQLIVTVEDPSLINDLKRAIKMMRGVSKISVKRTKKTGMDLAREDVKAGRVISYSCKEELFNDLGI